MRLCVRCDNVFHFAMYEDVPEISGFHDRHAAMEWLATTITGSFQLKQHEVKALRYSGLPNIALQAGVNAIACVERPPSTRASPPASTAEKTARKIEWLDTSNKRSSYLSLVRNLKLLAVEEQVAKRFPKLGKSRVVAVRKQCRLLQTRIASLTM